LGFHLPKKAVVEDEKKAGGNLLKAHSGQEGNLQSTRPPTEENSKSSQSRCLVKTWGKKRKVWSPKKGKERKFIIGDRSLVSKSYDDKGRGGGRGNVVK